MKAAATLLIGLLPAAALAAEFEGAPIRPLAPEVWQNESESLVLQNADITVVVVGRSGRIASIAPANGDNLFRYDPDAAGDFANFGGDWLWPVAQARWPAFNEGKDWPPPAILEQRPWSAHAWKNNDGSLGALLRIEYDAPLHIRVMRRLHLPAEGARLVIEQRIERTDDSDVPVTLWNISQVRNPSGILLPADAHPIRLGFEPYDEILAACPDALVFDVPSGTEHKIGSPSPAAWIAALAGTHLIVERVSNPPSTFAYPDGGCRVEVYSNSGLGYSELETLSPEVPLRKGESLQNRLVIELLRAPPEGDPCAVADRIVKQPALKP